MRNNLLIVILIISLDVISAGELRVVNTFETWNGGIASTDPAGICYNPNSGNLFISDSEIEEINAIWNCQNIFEISLDGNFINAFDSYDDDAQPCQRSASGSVAIGREPTGITFNEFDGFFYVADDEEHAIIRYNDTFGAPLAWLNILDLDENGQKPDLEGIASDPKTGYLYVLFGVQQEVRVYKSDLDSIPVNTFSLTGIARDPEGIAFNVERNHLFIVSSKDENIYELTLDGQYVEEYDISNILSSPTDSEGLTFAPTSDPNDDPEKFNLYISDIQEDNDDNPLERDGIIYEVEIITVVSVVDSEIKINTFSLKQNYPNPFNPTTWITYTIPKSDNVSLKIFNLQGQLIKTLVSDNVRAGSHLVEWKGRDEQGSSVSSGIYFYRIQAGKFSQTRKMFLLQ